MEQKKMIEQIIGLCNGASKSCMQLYDEW